MTISPACVRDVSWIAAHMRQRDSDEILCQAPYNTTIMQAALWCFDTAMEDTRFVAYDKTDTPAAAFGFSPSSNPTLWSAWAFGTDRMRRVIPEITDFGFGPWLGHFIKNYRPRRMEIRAREDHDLAHRWLTGMGAKREGLMPSYGRSGEVFVLYSWTDRSIYVIREKQALRAGARKRAKMRRAQTIVHAAA
jgi:hypothetical protein